MAFKALSENLEKSGVKAQEYLKNTTEYYKLRIFKTVTKGAISLVNFLIIGIVLLLVLLFFSMGAALWIGDVLESKYAGYFIVGGFYILIIIGFIIFAKKPLQKILLLKFSDMFFDNDDDPEPDVSTRIANRELPKTEEE
ncbi:putative superfamily III holin-X [Ulvibacter sp. MAR_2010_11]|uniref:phage holin family protein n=1 Tax=Ulvibacter sp. MAR_2010_11 TaxID=1250229 RepID=UPI000C2BDF53|nr:phage holin family protein [Ulvibacter sp. MAR_2010_11]PKA82941.1 putative superfamily III holin-X [Ulvibacter sp. MAR_2010_11]